MADFDFSILNILRRANGPMKAADIAELVSREHRMVVDESDVERCLYRSLSTMVTKDAQSKWSLRGKPFSQGPGQTEPPPASYGTDEPAQPVCPESRSTTQNEQDDQYRRILENDPSPFLDRVDTTWDPIAKPSGNVCQCLCCGDDVPSAAVEGTDRRLESEGYSTSEVDAIRLCPACFWEKVTGNPPPDDMLPPAPPAGRYGPYKDDTSPGWDNMVRRLEDS